MNRFIFIILSAFLLSNAAYAAAPKKPMSKEQLCDYAIQALEQLMQKSQDMKNKPTITKEQCMAISDKDIDEAIKKMTENGIGKTGKNAQK